MLKEVWSDYGSEQLIIVVLIIQRVEMSLVFCHIASSCMYKILCG